MILAALNDLYERLSLDPRTDVARRGYSSAPVVCAFEITREGSLIRAIPLGTQKGKTVRGLGLLVPEQQKRSSGDSPNFLCDKAEYFTGLGADGESTDDRSIRRKTLCLALHREILGSVDDDGAQAVIAFLSRPAGEIIESQEFLFARDLLLGGGNIVFRLSGDDGYIHERPVVMRAWEKHKDAPAPGTKQGQCLVTGTYGPISRLHMGTSGVPGAQSSGASLVSFNIKSFESYGKEQGQNSPVSERVTFAYGTALNWLVSNPRHRLQAGDTTIVFWAERAGPEEDAVANLFGATFGTGQESTTETAGADDLADTSSLDEAESRTVSGILDVVFRGRLPAAGSTTFDPKVRFYILGLSPNAARLSVRFWITNTFGEVIENLSQHYEDMAIVHREGARPVTVRRILMELVPPASRKREVAPKVLVGSLMRSILDGLPYPQSLYAVLLSRIRKDANDPDQPSYERKVNYPRAAYLKAHLRRKARVSGNKNLEEGLTEMLNPDNKDPGYLLGRLFALLEKAQIDANPRIKATIKDRYYASASATPGAVYPLLMRLAQHHLSKSEYGGYVDKMIEGVAESIDSFPKYLTLDQQGLFALGYYHQKSALYTKVDKEEKGEENHDTPS